MLVLTDSSLVALRKAATVAHLATTLRVVVRRGDRPVVEVGWPPLDPVSPSSLVLPPCGFRRAVGRAHRLALEGLRLSMIGLPDDVDPAVDVGAPIGGDERVRPDGTYHLVHADGRRAWALPTVLDPAACEAAVAPWPDDLRVWADDVTEVTVLHASAPHARVVELIGVAELMSELQLT